LADDAELVRRVQNGDAAAFQSLVHRYLPRAFSAARRLMSNEADAEDLVQDAFLRALQRMDQVDARRGFGPWFFRVLANVAHNARSSRELRRTEAELTEVASGEAGADVLMERAELGEALSGALGNLSARQREVITMFEVDGFSTAEIAAALGIAPETVRWHLHSARKALREVLQPLSDRPPTGQTADESADAAAKRDSKRSDDSRPDTGRESRKTGDINDG
jgi:RNA polymerase sigma-70 factor (ECF subfamily)